MLFSNFPCALLLPMTYPMILGALQLSGEAILVVQDVVEIGRRHRKPLPQMETSGFSSLDPEFDF